MRRLALAALLLGALACKKDPPQPKKTSPDEMIAALKAAGLNAEKGSSIMASVQNSEVAFHLTVDGHDCPAYRFSSVEVARDKGQSFEAGTSAGYWAFNCPASASETSQRMKAALEK